MYRSKWGGLLPVAYVSIFKIKNFIKEKTLGINRGSSIKRHRASFPPKGSIIAAAGLNFCVRNGNRCLPSAMGTEMRAQLTIERSCCSARFGVHAVAV